jgi:hypothetical protein
MIDLNDFWCFNATFNNISAISWRPVLVVEEAGVPGENHRPWSEYYYLTTHTSLSLIRREFAPSFVKYKKECTRLAAASDKVYQLLAHGSESVNRRTDNTMAKVKKGKKDKQ